MRISMLTTVAAAAIALSLGGVAAQTGGSGAAGASGGGVTGGSTGGPSGGAAGGAGAGSAPATMSPGGSSGGAGGAGSMSQGAQPKANQQAQPTQSGTPSTGQARQEQPGSSKGQAAEGQKNNMDTKGEARSTETKGDAKATGSTSANLSVEQRTQVRTSFRSANIRPLTNVNFNISVGTVVPQTVELYTVPADIVAVVPAWRGYRYIVVEEEIIIIEPSTRRIVTVIERTG